MESTGPTELYWCPRAPGGNAKTIDYFPNDRIHCSIHSSTPLHSSILGALLRQPAIADNRSYEQQPQNRTTGNLNEGRKQEACVQNDFRSSTKPQDPPRV